MSEPKSFDDAVRYEREIRALVPGYEALHALLPCVAAPWLTPNARVLCVGCGTGEEAVTLLRAAEGIELDAIDPSEEMCAATRATFARTAVAARANVIRTTLEDLDVTRPYDLVVVALVGHFIPDDGARATFMSALACALAASGVALVVELEACGDAQERLIDAHVHFSRRAGVPEDRLTVLRERLTTRFHLIGRDRWVELAEKAGLLVKYEFFRALCAFGMLIGRR